MCPYVHRSVLAVTDRTEEQLRGATPRQRSGAATESARLHRHRNDREELPPRPRSGAVAERSYPHPRSGRWPGGATPHPRSSGCLGAGGPRGATPCSRSGGAASEEYPPIQGKDPRLRFAGVAMKSYPTSKVRETQVDSRCCKRASEGRHTENIKKTGQSDHMDHSLI